MHQPLLHDAGERRQADKLVLDAQVRIAAETAFAPAARERRLDGHPLPDEADWNVVSDRFDDAHRLVADGHRQLADC